MRLVYVQDEACLMGIENVMVELSRSSKELLSKVCVLIDDPEIRDWHHAQSTEIQRQALIAMLSREIVYNKKSRFLLESFRAALLHDLHQSFLGTEKRRVKKEKTTGKDIARIILAIAGTIFAVCEGFDGISSLIGMFTVVPTLAISLVGLISSALSIVVFYGFDLVEISKNLDVKTGKSRQLLDVFLDQVEQIDHLKRIIIEQCAEANMTEMRCMQKMLCIRYDALDKARNAYTRSLENRYLIAAKFVMAAIAGVSFFGAGFFAGQSLSMWIASSVAGTVSVTFWPIILVSVVVGIAALCLYWFTQRPGLMNLVGRWFGLDKDKIDVFASKEAVHERKEELKNLEKYIPKFENVGKYSRLFATERPVHTIENKMDVDGHTTTPSFFKIKRSRSLNDLSLQKSNPAHLFTVEPTPLNP